MAIVANILTKSVSGGQNDIINGIYGMVFATDTVTNNTDALVIAAAVAALVAAGHPVPDSYFDTVALATVYDAEADYTVYGNVVGEAIA